MARSSGRVPRIFIEADLSAGARVELGAAQSHYLASVLRLAAGASVLVFNGRDGEWSALIERADRKRATLALNVQTWPQRAAPDIHYLFAPLKKGRLDYMVEKATEMGASVLQPVITAYTQAERLNGERMRAHAIEAAEQCGLVSVPQVREPVALEALLAGWSGERIIVFCDEGAALDDPIASLRGLAQGPKAVLVGPEGGFSPGERGLLRSLRFVHPISLGPRILRADTAAIAALALVNVVHGDWR
ncbi:MAG: 16S rRNA (uracil(1498)-N(3))-methyltransferase [Rhizobiales bacterium]|nr:16S rRNA (uracil(1498)-N(3))-methyltransferase [Hyphomicrobiales bacterium]